MSALNALSVTVNTASASSPSAAGTSLIDSVGSGGSSSSVMVPTPSRSRIVAFVAPDSVTVNVSDDSTSVSFSTGTRIVPVCSLGAMVTVPVAS